MIEWLIAIVVSAFACFRFAELIAVDRIAKPLRERMGVYDLGENGEPKTMLGYLFSCPYCLGIYPAFLCALCFDRSPTFPITWLAIAGGQVFLQTVGGRQ